MSSHDRPLPGFERRLLAELRRVIVAERQNTPSPIDIRDDSRHGRKRLSTKLALAGGMVALVAAALAFGLPFVDGTNGPTAAYAVRTNDDGTVEVEISAPRDAEGLERELREAGIPALVQYLPPGKACKEGTVALVRPDPAIGPIGSNKDSGLVFEIAKIAMPPHHTLVIQVRDDPNQAGGEARLPSSSLGLSVVEGEAKPCEVVDDADAPVTVVGSAPETSQP